MLEYFNLLHENFFEIFETVSKNGLCSKVIKVDEFTTYDLFALRTIDNSHIIYQQPYISEIEEKTHFLTDICVVSKTSFGIRFTTFGIHIRKKKIKD